MISCSRGVIQRFRRLMFGFMIVGSLLSGRAYGFMGVDAAMMIPYLVQLVQQAIQQYAELEKIYGASREFKELLENVHSGINESLEFLESLPIEDSKILAEIRSFRAALEQIESTYGKVPIGPDGDMLSIHDKSIAESLNIIRQIPEYARKQQLNADLARSSAATASPKGAARANLQTNAAILHTLNQLLKVNSQMLKIQSETLALLNKQAKGDSEAYHKITNQLVEGLKSVPLDFSFPTRIGGK